MTAGWDTALTELAAAVAQADRLLAGDAPTAPLAGWRPPADLSGPPDATQVARARRLLAAIEARAEDLRTEQRRIGAALQQLEGRRCAGSAYAANDRP